MSIADEIEAEVTTYGQQVILRRLDALTGTSLTQTDVTLFAVVRGYQPQQLVGNIAEGDRRVIIGNKAILAAEWPGPPRRNDRVVIDGKETNIIACDTANVGGEIVRHDIQVRG